MTQADAMLPAQDETHETAATSAVEAALHDVLACYDVIPDLKGMVARLARRPGPLRLDDIGPILSKLDIQQGPKARTPEEIAAVNLPALVVFADKTVAAYIPAIKNADRYRFYGRETADRNAIAACVTVQAPAPRTGHETKHMKRGHALDWFWAPVRKFWKQYAEILVTSLFGNLLMLALPLFTMNVYDRVAINFAESTLIVLTVGICVALVFDFLFKTLRSYILELVASRVGAQFDMDLMERFMTVRPMLLKLSIGEKTNLFAELQGIRDFYSGRLMPSLMDLPFFFLFTGIMYVISPSVALVPIIATVLIVLIAKGMQVPVDRSAEVFFKGQQQKSARLVQTLAGIDTLKMLGATGTGLFHWGSASRHSIETSRRNNLMITGATNLCIMITYMVNVFVLFVGVHEIAAGTLTVGGLVACSLLSGRAIAPVIQMAGLMSKMKQSSDVLKTIDKVFSLPHEDVTQTRRSPQGLMQGKIELADASFIYPDQPRPALQKVNLTIRPGEHVGLIGRTGAGKSTLARMICRFLDPVSGTVFIDGFAMDSLSPEELHRSIGYVPQEGFFFSGSVRSNILLGAEDASEDDLQRAVAISGLGTILQGIGSGLDMEVGEAGSRLSGGQKQALALARALVRNPSILVFDEPTNGVDQALEAQIKNGLESYLKGRTFVMITHRTSLLSLVDRLVLMDSGRVVADGPRDEIMAKLAAPASPQKGNANG